MSHLILSHYKRMEIVQRLGYSEAEIAAMEQEMAVIHRNRRVTLTLSSFGRLEHAFRSLGRKLKRCFQGRKEEEEDLA